MVELSGLLLPTRSMHTALPSVQGEVYGVSCLSVVARLVVCCVLCPQWILYHHCTNCCIPRTERRPHHAPVLRSLMCTAPGSAAEGRQVAAPVDLACRQAGRHTQHPCVSVSAVSAVSHSPVAAASP